jgi:hypothetical protein
MDNKKPTKILKPELKKPHHYGKRDGVHIFHATDESHKAMIGKHIHNPSDSDLNNAIKNAKSSDLSMVIIHGVPPDSLKSKIHPTLGEMSPDQLTKTEHKPMRSTEYEIEDDLNKGAKQLKQPAPPEASESFYHPELLGRTKINTGHAEVELGKHPITTEALHHHLKSGSYSLLTAQNPMGQSASPEENAKSNKSLTTDLAAHGAVYHPVKGKYGSNEEQSFLVHHTKSVTPELLEGFAKKYNQESVIHSSQGHHQMKYVNGDNTGKHLKGSSYQSVPEATDNYSAAGKSPSKKFSLNFNWDQLHDDNEVKKTEKISFEDLNKAFTQNDQSTFMDSKVQSTAVGGAHPKLMEWGAKHLSPLPDMAIESFELGGKTVKIRKHVADLYSGWVEHNGTKFHSFEKVTMPELMMQLQSKLELYGKEEEVNSNNEINDIHEKLKAIAHPWLEENGHEIPTHEFLMQDTKERFKKLKEKIETKQAPSEDLMTTDQLKELAEQIENNEVVIPNKELTPGIINPKTQCDDCGSRDVICDCFKSLPKPEIQVDYKNGSIKILFKSEYWDDESKSSFVQDLKSRAGRIIKNKWAKKL